MDCRSNILMSFIQFSAVGFVNWKIISKSENRYLDISELEPSEDAINLASKIDKDPKFIQAILNESQKVVRYRMGVLIVEHKLGFIHANAGIDRYPSC